LATARHAVKNMPSDIFLLCQLVPLVRGENAHDGRLVDSSDLVSASLGSVVESITGDSLGCLVCDKFDRLDDTIN
jgi:hypothetical protein